MPMFDFECRACRHAFEEIVSTASTTPECPSCHGHDVEKQLAAFAVGGSKSGATARPAMGPCGSCGDPRGPGACRSS